MVLNASLTLAWYFDDEANSAVDTVLADVVRRGAVVPPLWRLEVANGFQSAIQRKRIDQRYRDDSLAELRLLPIEIDSECDTRVGPPRSLWRTDLVSAFMTPAILSLLSAAICRSVR